MLSIYSALLLDAILKDPYSFPHPVKFIGKYISFFENKLRTEQNIKKLSINGLNSEGEKTLGFFLLLSTVAICYILTWLIVKISAKINKTVGYTINILIMWTCLSHGSLKNEVLKVQRHLNNEDIISARQQLSMLVSRDVDLLDEEGIRKALIETAAENTADGIISPLFYMFLGGAPLAMAYKGVNTLDSMVGYINDKYKDFGYYSAKFDDIVNFIPARLTALCMIVYAYIKKWDYKNGIRITMRDAKNSKSPNAGYPEAATAGIFSIQLLGDAKYFGKIVKKKTIGDKINNITKETTDNVLTLITGATIVLTGFYTLFKTIRFLYARKCKTTQS